MDPLEGYPIDHDVLEECYQLWTDQQNAVGSISIPNEEIQMSDIPNLLGRQQSQSPSLYPDGADHSEFYAFMDTLENGTEEVRLASTRP